MKQTTRVLSILLALLMAFSCVAVAADGLTVTATYNGADLVGATVPAGSEITLVFSDNVTDATVLAKNVGKIKVKTADGAEAGATVSVGTDEKTFVVTLAGDLAKGEYTLTIGKELAAADGTTLGKKAEFTFNVKGSGNGNGEKQLKVDSVKVNDTALEGATVKAGDTIVILFTNGMTENGAESAKLISIVKDDGTAVECEVTYPVDKSDDVAKKQFTVVVGKIDDGSYTLVLGAGIKANNGTTLGEDVKIAFTGKGEEPAKLSFWARIKQFFAALHDLLRNLFLLLLGPIITALKKICPRCFPVKPL